MNEARRTQNEAGIDILWGLMNEEFRMKNEEFVLAQSFILNSQFEIRNSSFKEKDLQERRSLLQYSSRIRISYPV
jgi:hypothetical protein